MNHYNKNSIHMLSILIQTILNKTETTVHICKKSEYFANGEISNLQSNTTLSATGCSPGQVLQIEVQTIVG